MGGKQIVILGGGFAGVRAAHVLRTRPAGQRATVTLVDRSPLHVNTPIMYEIASAFVPWEKEAVGKVMHEASGIPFVNVLDGTGTLFIQGTVDRIDAGNHAVVFTDKRELLYDVLLVALGAQTNTFNVPGVDTNAFGVKTIHEAAELRHHMVAQFLRHRSSPRKEQERAFTVVIAGGGNAGVETAAELILFMRKLARAHNVDPRLPRVIMYEGGDTILREYPVSLRRKGLERLEQLGVDVHTQQTITAVAPHEVVLKSGGHTSTNTVVWVGGIRAHDVLLRSGLPVNARGGLMVDDTLEVHGHQNIFAAGDCVYITDPTTGQTVPDVAWAAIHQGNLVGENIARRLEDTPLVSYLYHPRPTFATVGGKYALVNLPPFQFAGWVGWVVKQLIDLWYLMSILPNGLAFRSWRKSVRVRMAND